MIFPGGRALRCVRTRQVPHSPWLRLLNLFERINRLATECFFSGGRALRCVRTRQVSHSPWLGRESSEVRAYVAGLTLRGSERINRFVVLCHLPLGAERRSLNQGALYAAGPTLSVAPVSEFFRALTETTCRDGHSATVNATPVEVNICSAFVMLTR